MKMFRRVLFLALSAVLTLSLTACGRAGEEIEAYEPPEVVEGIRYDPDGQEWQCADFLGEWVGADGTEYDTMTVSEADGGMYIELYKGGEVVVTGCAQLTTVDDHANYYFFNDADGKAYLLYWDDVGDEEGCRIAAFGAFLMRMPAPRTDEAFADIAGTWYLGGAPDATSYLEIDANGEWAMYGLTEDGEYAVTDNGYLEQEPANQDRYHAWSRQSEGTVYDMGTTFDKDAVWWGDGSDVYLPADETVRRNAQLLAQYAGSWFGGETFWLRIREDATYDVLDESGQVFNEDGYVVVEDGRLELCMEGYGSPQFALRPQEDGTLYDEIEQRTYTRAAEEDLLAAR